MSCEVSALAQRLIFADEQAEELGDESGFGLAFDLRRAGELEQHA